FSYSANWLNVIFSNNSTSSAGGSNLHYLWNFSDGTTSTATNPSKSFATGGLKIVTLHIFDSATLCSSSYTDTLMLNSGGNNCVSNFTKTISGLTVNLTNTSLNGNGTTAGLAYYWSFSEGPNSYVKNPTKIFSSSGVKWVQLQVFDSITNCTSLKIDSFLLSSSSNCQANFTKSVSGLSVTLGNSSTNTNGLPAGLSYYWNFGDGTTSTQKDPVKTYASGGSKIIQLTISDSLQACYATKYDSVFLVAPTPLCSASFTMAIDTTTPFNFFLLNTSLVRPNSAYLWNFGDGNSSTSITPSHTYANFGSYLVCLTVSDSLCTSMFCDSVGMDSTGILLKGGAFGFQTLDFTTKAVSNSIAQEFGLNQYAIYPNPSNAIFNVEVDVKSASPITFQVTDISGKIIFTKSVLATAGKHIEAIDLSDVHASIYFLSIFSNEGISTHKIIKN
ncbi:MAG: PKD domain-containing protein, partial [Bacteroidota bacterium]|nr:PKD domain-containing protein [Bacteroidota bacterium]